MKKEILIGAIKERFSNLPQDIAVVVVYKTKKYSIRPEELNFKNFIKNYTVKELNPFYYGEIVEEQKELCENPEFQYLTFRAEAPCDFFRFAFYCSENKEDIMFDNFQQSDSWYKSHRGRLAAPSELSLIEVKKMMWVIAKKYNIPDVHVLIQSLDYPVFSGLRDRYSPNPLDAEI